MSARQDGQFGLHMVDYKPARNGWHTITCPVCGNKRAGVKQGDTAWVFHCWEGCTIEEFCDTLGIPVSAMFYEERERRPWLRYDPEIERHIVAQAIVAKRNGTPLVGADRERALLAYRRVGGE